jgi:hypothetical protein
MPPLDSWLEITFQAPFLLLPVLAFVLIGLVVGGIRVYRQRSTRLGKLSDEIQALRAQS